MTSTDEQPIVKRRRPILKWSLIGLGALLGLIVILLLALRFTGARMDRIWTCDSPLPRSPKERFSLSCSAPADDGTVVIPKVTAKQAQQTVFRIPDRFMFSSSGHNTAIS